MKKFLIFLVVLSSYMARILAFAIKVAVVVCIACLIFALCSCRTSRPVMTETAAADSFSVLDSAKDSVRSELNIAASGSGYIDISDLSIIFYPAAAVQIPVSPVDSVADEPPKFRTPQSPQSPQILYPALLNIGHLSAGNTTDATLKASKDSVGSNVSDISHEQSNKDTAQRIRDPTKSSWPIILSLCVALVIILYTGYLLYRSKRL